MTTNRDLIQLLQRRKSIIADHAWRDRDPAAHLDGLKQVSEEISTWAEAHRSRTGPRLRHFLANASFDKALSHLEAGRED